MAVISATAIQVERALSGESEGEAGKYVGESARG